jgi:phospholipid transport system substrate-binding protein
VLRILMAGVLTVCATLPSSAQDGDAVAVVESLHAALLHNMQNADTLGFEGRRDRIAPVIKKSFDLKFIARFVLGRHRESLSSGQQREFRDVFTNWTIANYAARFNGYASERFVTVSSEEARKGRVVVRTVLEVNDDRADDVTLDYLLRQTVGKWRIINVIAKGVSDLSLKRADYGAVIKSQGFNSLIEKLNQQIGEFDSGT